MTTVAAAWHTGETVLLPRQELVPDPPKKRAVDPRAGLGYDVHVLLGRAAQLNTSTGEVTATQSPPPRLRSFRVRPQINRTASSPLLAPPTRFCFRESVSAIGLTPLTLTAAGNANGQRFTVLALFDLGTIGDIPRLAANPVAGQTPNLGSVGPPRNPVQLSSTESSCVRIDRLAGLLATSACSAVRRL